MSLRLEMSYFLPVISSALSRSCCIPSFEPAKPSLRLSSIVKFCFAKPWYAFWMLVMSEPKTLALSDMSCIAMSATAAAFAVSPSRELISDAEKLVTCSMYWFADMPAVL